jgi:DNA-binding transcriptional ArsR family regulator
VDVFGALAEPRRREIVGLVWKNEREAGQIHRALGGITFGAVSQHLKILRESGAVRVRPDGRRRLYRADRAALRGAFTQLERMWADKLGDLKSLAEDEERGKRR